MSDVRGSETIMEVNGWQLGFGSNENALSPGHGKKKMCQRVGSVIGWEESAGATPGGFGTARMTTVGFIGVVSGQ